jgi:hypothetical protein
MTIVPLKGVTAEYRSNALAAQGRGQVTLMQFEHRPDAMHTAQGISLKP